MTQTLPTVLPPDTTLQQKEPAAATGPIQAAPSGVRGGAHIAGAFSIETFCDQGGLSLTHEDAQGFLQWLSSYGLASNFWFRDAAVKIWAYYETYDNWQDTYGLDADLTSYHSGHGGMDANGIFYVPMGAAWAGNDCTAMSDNMAVGNEYCRYLFWSTCLSLRVLDGHSPIRTWNVANKGLRMIFGFETVSWDSADYGKNFGNRWNAGDSLSSAWLNGSWAIAHDQAPSVAACGETAAEAQDRLFNERYFSWNSASNAWYWWRWYYAAAAVREPNRHLPRNPIVARLAPTNARSVRAVTEAFGLDVSQATRNGAGASISDGRLRLTVGDDGSLVAQLADPNRSNRQALEPRDAQDIAGEVLHRYGLDAEASLVLDRVAYINEAGASAQQAEAVEGPYRTGTLVQYRQVIAGVPVVTPGAGTVQVVVDNDGVATSVTSTARVVEELREHPYDAPATEPTPRGAEGRRTGETETPDTERLLAKAFSDRLRSIAFKGDLPVGFGIVPGSTEIGYDVQGDNTVLVAQRAVELDFGEGYKKRYWIKAPLFG
jgi:hypothetical protein